LANGCGIMRKKRDNLWMRIVDNGISWEG